MRVTAFLRRNAAQLRRAPLIKLEEMFWDCAEFAGDVVLTAVKNAVKTVRALWRNAESVAILSVAGMGVSHFIGEIAITHPFLAFVFISEMISPLIAVVTIWVLLRIAMWRRSVRISHAIVG